MKLIEKIKEIIEKNKDCRIESEDGLKITGQYDDAEYILIGIDYEADDDCILVETRAQTNGSTQSFESKAFDIEDMTKLETALLFQQELL